MAAIPCEHGIQNPAYRPSWRSSRSVVPLSPVIPAKAGISQPCCESAVYSMGLMVKV